MKILFIIPEIKSMFGTEKGIPIHPHVGIAYLTSVLKKNHHQVKIIDCGVENNWSDQITQLLSTFKPDIIGITGFSYAYKFLYQTIKKVQSLTKTPILLGGPHVSATKEKILQETKVNYAMYGESETSFIIFLDQLSQAKPDLSTVPNLIWKQKKQIIINSPAPPIHQLDNIPFPDYQSFNLKKYPCYEAKIIPIITSRGCPYGCNYCSVRLSMGQNFRPRSPKNVIKEIKYWYKRGFINFDFNDDCFTLDINRAETICDLIIKNRLKIKFQLYNGIRVNNINLKLLKKMKKAGCFFIAYGCESGSQKTLDNIKKNITLDQVIKAVELTRRAKIHHAVNFIIGHQNETYQDAIETFNFAKKLQCDYVNFYNLVPYPGTEVYQWAIKHAKFLYPKKEYLKEISYRDINPIFETQEFTKEQRIKIMKKGFRLYERKLYQFKFGKFIGTFLFLITRINLVAIVARKIIYHNQKARELFQRITQKSKE
ncbi:MAG: B12-binding domain-containing radical SAM protein [Candidatus Shapirobacteria bacterium]|nr:B12-binding domain-containing radical SAM protein [Candidatus Shapirobacteria bacterium]